MGLVGVAQDDFAVGSYPAAARHLIPPAGLYGVSDGLLDDDGAVYRRGGSSYQSLADFGTSLRWVWDGTLAGGRRTVFASPAAFGVLAADETTPVSLGGAGLSVPVRAAVIGGMLFIGGGTIYAGSRKAADYSTGTVAVTQGSAVVTGSGFSANVDAGMLLRVGGAGPYYAVQSVDSDTQVTLSEPYRAATAGAAGYVLSRLGTAGEPYVTADHYEVVGQRLIAATGPDVRFSEGVDPTTGRPRAYSFPVENLHRLPGVVILGLAAAGDRLLVFTTAGQWMISNLAYNLVDAAGEPQHRIERRSDELVLWDAAGVAAWKNALVAPCVDAVWLVDGISEPVELSHAIESRYVGYVRAGHRPGGAAVFKSHLFLPILDASGGWVDMLVCRLDRPTKLRSVVSFPWTFWAGHGGKLCALAVKVAASGSRSPELLGASRLAGRVLRLTRCFAPDETREADADGTVHNLVVETRDYTLGQRVPTHTRKVRLRYELEGAGATIRASASVGRAVGPPGAAWNEVDWNEFVWADARTESFVALAGQAPEDAGRKPYGWDVVLDGEFVRYRFESVGACARCVIRAVESRMREGRRIR